jgi:hypothetical protein
MDPYLESVTPWQPEFDTPPLDLSVLLLDVETALDIETMLALSYQPQNPPPPPSADYEFAPPPEISTSESPSIDVPAEPESPQKIRAARKMHRRERNKIAARVFRENIKNRLGLLEKLVVWLRVRHPLIALEFEKEKRVLL